jgi:hypothetical protein
MKYILLFLLTISFSVQAQTRQLRYKVTGEKWELVRDTVVQGKLYANNQMPVTSPVVKSNTFKAVQHGKNNSFISTTYLDNPYQSNASESESFFINIAIPYKPKAATVSITREGYLKSITFTTDTLKSFE